LSIISVYFGIWYPQQPQAGLGGWQGSCDTFKKRYNEHGDAHKCCSPKKNLGGYISHVAAAHIKWDYPTRAVFTLCLLGIDAYPICSSPITNLFCDTLLY